MNSLLAVLASHRAARAVSIDTITDPLRRRVKVWSIADKATAGQRARRHYLHELLKCPMCTGFWLSGITVLAWRRGPRWLRGPMMWWAVAGGQTFVTSLHHLIDMRADLIEEQVKAAKKAAAAR